MDEDTIKEKYDYLCNLATLSFLYFNIANKVYKEFKSDNCKNIKDLIICVVDSLYWTSRLSLTKFYDKKSNYTDYRRFLNELSDYYYNDKCKYNKINDLRKDIEQNEVMIKNIKDTRNKFVAHTNSIDINYDFSFNELKTYTDKTLRYMNSLSNILYGYCIIGSKNGEICLDISDKINLQIDSIVRVNYQYHKMISRMKDKDKEGLLSIMYS